MFPGHLSIINGFLAEFGPSHGRQREFWIVCPLALPPWLSASGKAPRRAKKRCALFMQVVLADQVLHSSTRVI